MFPWLLILLSIVLLGSIWRLCSHRRRKRRDRATKFLVIITANSQATLEWWIRSFAFWNWIHGNPQHCVCIDLGSTDDTLAVLERLQFRYGWMEVRALVERERSSSVETLISERLLAQRPLIIDLRQPENCRIRSLAQDLS